MVSRKERLEKEQGIRERMLHAEKCLAPLFRLEQWLNFEAKFEDFLVYRSYKGDDRIETIVSHTNDPTNFDIGNVVAVSMYIVANPKVSAKSEFLMKKEVEKHDFDAFGVLHDPDSNRAKACLILNKIITACSGFAYAAVTERIEQNPLSVNDAALQELWKQVASGKNDATVFVSILNNVAYSLKTANELYAKRGYKIIEELAPLSFEQARQRILTYTQKDILKPKD